MATLLWFNFPAYGHLNATLPIVAELRRRGHEVRYCCTEETRAPIERSGAEFVPYPHTSLSMEAIARATKRLFPLGPLFLEASHRLVPFAEAEIRRADADLVLFDGMAVWAGIAARVTGTPAVTTYPMLVLAGSNLGLGRRNNLRMLVDQLRSMPATKREVDRLAETWGADAVQQPLIPFVAERNLVFMAREFHHPSTAVDERFVFVGPSLDDRTRESADWERPPGSGPLVYVSLGTVNNRSRRFYRELVAAFRGYPARFVLYLGPGVDRDALGPFPDNFVVSSSIPQLRILEEADAFVTHGGMGSAQEGLYNGVPLVIVPQQFEQVINGRRVAALGAGVILGDRPPYGRVRARQLRQALDAVLADDRYRRRARELGHDARAAGGYARAADEIEALLP